MRDRHTHTQIQIGRQTDRQTEMDRQTETDGQTEMEGESEERMREIDRERENSDWKTLFYKDCSFGRQKPNN